MTTLSQRPKVWAHYDDGVYWVSDANPGWTEDSIYEPDELYKVHEHYKDHELVILSDEEYEQNCKEQKADPDAFYEKYEYNPPRPVENKNAQTVG